MTGARFQHEGAPIARHRTVRRRCRLARPLPPGETPVVGYNPYRKFRARPADYAMVVAAFAIGVGLLAWGFLS